MRKGLGHAVFNTISLLCTLCIIETICSSYQITGNSANTIELYILTHTSIFYKYFICHYFSSLYTLMFCIYIHRYIRVFLAKFI